MTTLFDEVVEYPVIHDLSGGWVRYNTAIHEAGHGVLAYHYKLDIEHIKINETNWNKGSIKLPKIEQHAITEDRAIGQLKTHFAGIIAQRLYTSWVKLEHFCADAKNIQSVLDFGLYTTEDLVPLFNETKEYLSIPEIRDQIEILAKSLYENYFLSGEDVCHLLSA